MLFLLLALSVHSCAKSPVVVFSVSNLPPDLATLEAWALLDGKDAKERPTFDLRGLVRQTTYVFGYRLPEGVGTALLVSVAARDASGCILRTGTAKVELGAVQGNVDLPLDRSAPAPTANCWSATPTILQIEPVLGTPGQLRLRGFGFEAGATARVARLALDPSQLPIPCEPPTRTAPACDLKGASLEASVPSVTRVSPTELLLRDDTALRNDTGRLGICVIVTNPDQRSYCRPTEGDDEILSVTFTQTQYSLGRNVHPDGLVIADLDKDGSLDLALSATLRPDDVAQPQSGQVLWLLNNTKSPGTFPSATRDGELLASPEVVTVGESSRSVATADFDKDGKPDLVVGDQAKGEIVYLHNKGAPGLFLRSDLPRFPAGAKPDAISAGDLDGDGNTDLAMVNDSTSANIQITGMTVLRNVNKGQGFSPPESYVTALGVFWLALGDFDGQPGVDVMTNGIRLPVIDNVPQPEGATGGALLFRNQGDGTLLPNHPRMTLSLLKIWPAMIPLAGVFGTLTTVDIDGNGVQDVLCSGAAKGGMAEAGSTVSVLRNDGTGAFQVEEYPAGKSPFSMGVADFNGDGLRDIVVTNGLPASRGRVTLLLQQKGAAPGRRFPAGSLPTYSMGIDSGYIAVGDLNGDGKPDMVVANYGTLDAQDPRRSQSGSVTIYLNTTR